MRLRASINLPSGYDEFLSIKEDKDRWEALVRYLKQLTLAITDDRREIARVVNFNDGRVAAGEAEGTSGYIRIMDRFLLQHGHVSGDGEVNKTITFPVPFTATNYRMVGSLKGVTAPGFTGGQAIRFPPGDRATTGCIMALQSTDAIGVWSAEWIAVGTG